MDDVIIRLSLKNPKAYWIGKGEGMAKVTVVTVEVLEAQLSTLKTASIAFGKLASESEESCAKLVDKLDKEGRKAEGLLVKLSIRLYNESTNPKTRKTPKKADDIERLANLLDKVLKEGKRAEVVALLVVKGIIEKK